MHCQSKENVYIPKSDGGVYMNNCCKMVVVLLTVVLLLIPVSALGTLKVQVMPKDPVAGEEVRILVMTGITNKPVEGAKVYVKSDIIGKTLIGETDSNGELKYTFEEPGTYMIGVEKEGYASLPVESGEVVEKVPASKPVHLSIGSGRILKAVEAGMLGMNPGETRTIRIQPEDAYGAHHTNLVHDIKRSVFSGRIDPRPGMILSLTIEKNGGNEQVPATVTAVNEETVTVDYNHPLAGKVLTYAVTLHAIGS